jgi:hypothetical protein
MIEAILVILTIVAVYTTATMLTLIFKGTFKLAPIWVKITAWVMATIGAVVSALFIYGIVAILLPIV